MMKNILAIPLLCSLAHAGIRERVAVAEAEVRAAQAKRAEMQSQWPVGDFTVANLQYENAELQAEVNHLRDEATTARQNIKSYKKQIDDLGAGKSEAQDATTDGSAAKQPDAEWTRPPVLSLAKPVMAGPQELVVTVFTGEDQYGKGWCVNCPRAKERFGIGGGRLRVDWSTAVAPGEQIYPAFRFRDATGSWRFPSDAKGHYRQPANLDELLAIVERNYGHAPAAATGAMGSVNIRPQVEWGLNYFASNVRGPIVTIWDSNRNNGTGAKDGMPILHAKSSDYSCDRLMGTFGSFSIRCDAGIQVGDQLFKQLDITYKSDGDELKVLTSFGIKKAALEPHQKATAFTAEPSGIDPGTALTIFSILQAIWQMAHPELDLQLPGRMQATIDVKDSAFFVDFDGAPRIRAKMYWEWMLEMDWVTVSTTKAHVEFVDQKDYWIKIKSRELAVN